MIWRHALPPPQTLLKKTLHLPQLCEGLRSVRFWWDKFVRGTDFAPYSEAELVDKTRRDEEAAGRMSNVERGERITSIKYFFILKMLDPLMVTLSANKHSLGVSDTIKFKVGI